MFWPQGLSVKKKSWRPVLSADKAKRSKEIVLSLASRFADEKVVDRAAISARTQSAYPQFLHWHPYGIAQGDAGIALMFGYLDLCFPGEGWDKCAHAYILRASRPLEKVESLPIGLHSGLSGLAYVIAYLSRNGERYRKLLSSVEEILFRDIEATCSRFERSNGYFTVHQWDLISGFSGIARYLLTRKNDPRAFSVLQKVNDCLIAISRDLNGVPRWYTPPELLSGEDMRKRSPGGNLNCGLAHGIPGPLSVLSLAKTSGMNAVGLKDAISRLSEWLLASRVDDKWGMNWPSVVNVNDGGTASGERSQSVNGLAPCHAAWCYGSPGISAALCLAGRALNNDELITKSVESARAVVARPFQERKIFSPTFCHGFAGEMQIMMRFANNTSDQLFSEEAVRLSDKIIREYYSPELPLGFQSYEAGNRKVDQPGLLDGAPGVVLVLLAAISTVEPKWDNIFLLS